jgi:hypothetical protein
MNRQLNMRKSLSDPQLPFHCDAESDPPPSANGKKKRVAGGIATSKVIVSAHVAGNAEVFPQILELHVQFGSTIADVTYGKGIFWRQVDLSKYRLFPSDIQTGIDCRELKL